MFEIVFEFCAMVFCIVTVGAWVVILPIVIKNSLDDMEEDKKYREKMRTEMLKEIEPEW